jgi:hypothetical protein
MRRVTSQQIADANPTSGKNSHDLASCAGGSKLAIDNLSQRLIGRQAGCHLVECRRHRRASLDGDLPSSRQLKETSVSRPVRLLSPHPHHVAADRVSLVALAEHLTVGGGDGQSRGWHLPDPKIGGQNRGRMGYLGSDSQR